MPARRAKADGAGVRRRRSTAKADGVVRLVDAQGESPRSWAAAVADAVRSVRGDVPEPLAVEVVRHWADLDAAGRLVTYRVAVRVAERQRITGPR